MNKPGDLKIGEWAGIWLRDYAAWFYEPKTTECYTYAFRRAFKNNRDLSTKSVNDLTHKEFQCFINSLESKYAKSTINHIRAAFSALYKAAIENEYCTVNPILGTHLPRDAAEKTICALTKRERSVLLEYLEVEQYRNVIEFFLYTGLRLSELINLGWDDYDCKRNIIFIRESKTAAGVRVIPLIPEALLIIEHQRMITEQEGYIFQKASGSKITKSTIRRTVERIRKHTGIAHFTIHVLRHTFATRLVEQKADYKAISKLLGHTSVAFTLQRYVTLDTEFLRDQVMLLSQVNK